MTMSFFRRSFTAEFSRRKRPSCQRSCQSDVHPICSGTTDEEDEDVVLESEESESESESESELFFAASAALVGEFSASESELELESFANSALGVFSALVVVFSALAGVFSEEPIDSTSKLASFTLSLSFSEEALVLEEEVGSAAGCEEEVAASAMARSGLDLLPFFGVTSQRLSIFWACALHWPSIPVLSPRVR